MDISSEKEGEIEILTERERTSTPVSKNYQENYRIVLEISHSSTGAIADEEEYFDISADSLESNCKRMKLDSSRESLGLEDFHNSSVESPHSAMTESQESTNVQENRYERDADDNSGVFIVESHKPPSTESITSTVIADFLDQVREEDASSYFVTPPGPLKKVIPQPISPLNDLEAIEKISVDSEKRNNYGHSQYQSFQFRQPGKVVRPMTVALSQSAPRLDCGYRRVGYGR